MVSLMVSPPVPRAERPTGRPAPRLAVGGRRGRPLSAARQKELIRIYREDGEYARAAKDRVVEANLGLVYKIVADVMRNHEGMCPVKVALEASGTIIDRGDLNQEGVAAFTAALEGYDPSRGRTLGAYAGEAVLHALYTALAKGRFVPMHHEVSRALGRYVEARDEVRQNEDREPSRDELARRIGPDPSVPSWTVKHVESALSLTRRPVPLQADESDGAYGRSAERAPAALFSDGGKSSGAGMPVETSAETEVMTAEAEISHRRLLWRLNQALASLEDGDRAIVEDLFGLGGRTKMTAVDVARKRGVCRQRVYQIRARAFDQLRAALGSTDGSEGGFGETPVETSGDLIEALADSLDQGRDQDQGRDPDLAEAS